MGINRALRDHRVVEVDGIQGSGRDGVSQIPIPMLSGIAESGTWAADASTGKPTVTRTTNDNTTERFIVPIPGFAGAMIKPISYQCVYTVATADAGDDVTFELVSIAIPADGAAQAAVAAIAGEDDTHYDAAHDTAAERADDTAGPELHTATITVPAAKQVYLAAGVQLELIIKVIEAADATGALAVIVNQGILTARVKIL